MKPLNTQRIALAILTLTWGLPGFAVSQETPATPPPLIELSQNPLNMPGIGLEIRLPVGSTSTQQTMNREVFAEVLGEDNLWRLTISSRTSANKNLLPMDAANQIRENLQKSFAALSPTGPDKDENFQSFAQMLDEVTEMKYSGGSAFRFFLRQPAPSPNVPDLARGVAVINMGEGQMLVWDMTAPFDNYAIAKAAMDATLKGIQSADGKLAVPDREFALKTGHALIQGIDPASMREIFKNHGENFYRLYRQPEGTEEQTEIGYRRVRSWAGKRSDVGGKGSISAAEGKVPGYLVEIQARSLDEASQGLPDPIIYDSKGTYFVSEDFTKEAWNLVVIIKRGKQSTTFNEVGARDGFEELLITTATPSGSNESYRHKIQREGYLPMALALILPTILADTEATGDVAFYTYRSDSAAVTFRHDSIRHDTENPDRYIHHTSVSLDSPQITKEVDAEGNVLREELPGDRYWVETDVGTLAKIWRAKGLPMN